MNKYKPELSWLARNWRRQLYSKVENLFIFENLPEEINVRAMQLWLIRFGKLIFYKIGDKFLVQPFSYTDRLDWYYIPKYGRVVNPWLPIKHQNLEFEIDKEAVIWSCTPNIYSFKEHSLESDLIFKTSNQLAENDISYYCIQRNHRLIAVLTAQDDKQRAEANRILEHMYNGDAELVMKEDLVSRINVNPISMNATRSPLTELVEFQQYILANFYHSFGINSNYNLKREQLNSSEIDVNKDVLRLNIEDMLVNRQKGVERINEIYGLDIRVSLNEKVYATLLEISENGEQGGLREDVSKSERLGFENTDEEEQSSSEEPSNDMSGSEVSGDDTDTGQQNTEDVSENKEEVQQDETTQENTDREDSERVFVTVIVNNGEISNLSTESETSETSDTSERSDDDVAVQEPEKMG